MTTTQTLTIGGPDPVQVTYTDAGEGHPVLLLHGGGGPQTVAAFGALLASAESARVIVPTHPGWAGTPRPESLGDIKSLAALYGRLLEELDLADVTVVGNSIGGWVAAEMALLHSPRISSVVLIGATGLELAGHPVVDFFSLTMDQVAELSYHDPDGFRIDVSALPPAAQAAMAGNRATLAVLGGTTMVDTGLADRLPAVAVPTLVLWGDSDRIVDVEIGRAYAAIIPDAEFRLLPRTGHLPQLETPAELLPVVWDFATAHTSH